MRWVWVLALAACQGARSAERQESFGQEVQSRRDEGAWTRETWEWGPYERIGVDPLTCDPGSKACLGKGTPGASTPRATHEAGTPGVKQEGYPTSHNSDPSSRPTVPAGAAVRHTLETHAPVVVSTTTQTNASTEAESHSSYRFGWSPWAWALGLLALAAGLYGLLKLKARLGV